MNAILLIYLEDEEWKFFVKKVNESVDLGKSA